MAKAFFEIRAALTDVGQRAIAAQGQLAQAQRQVVAALADVQGLAATYAPFLSDLDALASSDVTDPAVKAAKAEKDRLVGEVIALGVRLGKAKAALENI